MEKELLKLIKHDELNHYYELRIIDNNKFIGEIIRDVDGFFYYYPIEDSGGFSGHALFEIASKLKKLNKPMIDSINEYFEKQKQQNI